MDLTSLIIFLIVGAVAGWLAGNLMKGSGFGLIGNIIVGVLGAFIGSWLQNALDLSLGGGFIGSIVSAVLGAVVLLFIVGLVKK